MGYSDLVKRELYKNEPQGKDPFGKLWFYSKLGLLIGPTWGLHNGLVVRGVTTPQALLYSIVSHTVPMTAMCAMYGSILYTSASLRKKEDCLNTTIASMATASVLYSWKKQPKLILPFILLCSALSCAKFHYGDMNPFGLYVEDDILYNIYPLTDTWHLTKDPRDK